MAFPEHDGELRWCIGLREIAHGQRDLDDAIMATPREPHAIDRVREERASLGCEPDLLPQRAGSQQCIEATRSSMLRASRNFHARANVRRALTGDRR